MKISEVLPRELLGIKACCDPMPPLVKQNLNEIHRIIVDARSKRVVECYDQVEQQAVNKNVSVNLSNDPLMDVATDCAMELDNAEEQHLFVPLLGWDQQLGQFRLKNDGPDSSKEVGNDNGKKVSKTLINTDVFFNSTKFSCDSMFPDYVSPFQKVCSF